MDDPSKILTLKPSITQPKISVVIPAYNPGTFILETVQSVASQTYSNLEIMVIDDGSTDDILSVLRSIDDPRLQVFTYANGGLANARNRGISHATGELIAFLDHDDLWTASKLEDQLNALQSNPDAGVAYSWTTYFRDCEDGCRRYLAGMSEPIEGHIYPQLLLSNFIESGSNILARREVVNAIGGFDATPVCNEDWDYYLRLAAKFPFVVVPKFQILYRQTSGSMSSSVQKFEHGGLTLIEKTYTTVPKALQSLKSASLANHYRYCTELYLNQVSPKKSTGDAWRSLKAAITYRPRELLRKKTILILFRLILKTLVSPSLFQRLQALKQQQQWRSQGPQS